MILIGQYDSPFVRRVGIAMRLFGLDFVHEPWSVFRDADKLVRVNPLMRVPTLVLDDGTVLTESHVILDYLESRAPTGEGLFPHEEPARHTAMRVSAFACGIGDKVVSLFYEKRLHTQTSDFWIARCQSQIRATFALLEAERAAIAGDYWVGDRLSHADIAAAVMVRFAGEAHPGLMDTDMIPALRAAADRLEAMPVFQEIRQEFIPPA